MSVSLSPQWSVSEQYSDLVTLEGPAELGFIIVTDATKVADSQPPFAWVPFPADFAAWVGAHGLFHVVGSQPIVISGIPGLRIDAIGTDACKGAAGKQDWILLQSTGWNCHAQEHWQFIYLENVNGERLLIINSGGPAATEQFNSGLEASQKIFDSVVFTK